MTTHFERLFWGWRTRYRNLNLLGGISVAAAGPMPVTDRASSTQGSLRATGASVDETGRPPHRFASATYGPMGQPHRTVRARA